MSEEKPSLDTLIDRFDHQWRSGDKPDYQSFLVQAPESERPALLAKLLAIEIEYRIRNSESVNATDYHLLGNSARQLVDQLIATHAGDGGAASVSPALMSVESQTGNTIGPYQLLEKIGEGGMGVVWKAQQAKPVKRLVALKLIKSGFADKQVIARFEAERQAIALMSDPHIAKVFDVGTLENGLPWFAMELVEGQPVTGYCNQHRLDVRQRLELFVQICKAVQHAHQKGIIHRDLKPSNILVKQIEGQPVPKIIDFSLAKALESQQRLTDKTLMTEFGQIMGTIQYMSPEQASLGTVDIDTRTDVYSLGVVLYQLLTGVTPIDQDTITKSGVLQVLSLIRETDPPKPSRRLRSAEDDAQVICHNMQIAPEKLLSILEGDLDWVVMHALEKDRSRRYDSANEFAEDIQRYLNGDAVDARPPSNTYRFRKFVSKRKGLAAAGFAILTLLIAGITGTSLGLVRAVRETARADEQAEAALNQKEIAEARTVEAIAEKKRAQFAVYNGKMNLAAQAVEDGEPARALDILDEQIPADGEDDLRGFEWHYLWDKIHPGLEKVIGSRDLESWWADFSPDGKLLAISGFPVEIRNINTGKLENSVTSGNQRYASWLKFSNSGKLIAIANSHGNVMVCRVPDLEIVWNIKTDMPFPRSGCWTSDDSRIYIGSENGKVYSFDGNTGSMQATADCLLGPVRFLSIDAADQHLYGSCAWHIAEPSKCSTQIFDIKGLEISPAERLNGRVICELSPDGKHAVGGTSGHLISRMDMKNHEVFDSLKSYHFASSCCFTPFANRLITGGRDRKAIFWNADNSENLLELPHSSTVIDVGFSKTGDRWFSLSKNGEAKVWRTSYLRNLSTAESDNTIPGVKCHDLLSLSGSGSVLAANYSNPMLIDTIGSNIASIQFPGLAFSAGNHGRQVACLMTENEVAQEHVVAICGLDGTVEREVRIRLPGDTPRKLQQGVLSENGRYLAMMFPDIHQSSAFDNSMATGIVTLDLDATDTPHVTTRVDRTHAFALSSDSRYLATAGQGGRVGIWDVTTGKLVEQLQGGANDFTYSIAFSEDCKYVAAGLSAGEIKVWDISSIDVSNRFFGMSELKVYPGVTRLPDIEFQGLKEGVHAVAFFPDSLTLVSASGNIISLLDLESKQERIALATEAWVKEVAVTSDGKTILARQGNGKVLFFRTDSGTCNWNEIETWHSSADGRVKKFLKELFNHEYSIGANLEGLLAQHSLVALAKQKQFDEFTGERLEVLEYFKDSTDLAKCEQVLKSCLLRPVDATCKPKLEALALKCLRLAEANFEKDGNLWQPAFARAAVALADYRAGQWQQCLDRLKDMPTAAGGPEWTWELFCFADTVAAMAHQRLGHEQKSRGLVEKIRKVLDSKQDFVRMNLNFRWAQTALCEVLLNELEAGDDAGQKFHDSDSKIP